MRQAGRPAAEIQQPYNPMIWLVFPTKRARLGSVGPGFNGQKSAPRTSDWARIELAEPVPAAVAPLPIAAQAAYSGEPIMLAGYNQDRIELLMADKDCRVGIVTKQPGGTILLHDCSATRGSSGGPLP